VIASIRANVSPGAAALVASFRANLASQLGGASASSTVAQLSKWINVLPGDEDGQARALLIGMAANLPALNVPLRAYTGLVLTQYTIESAVGLNAYGRYLLRAAFVRAYLKTSPPLSEATAVVDSQLKRIKDPIAKAPILDAFVAQFPEVAIRSR
jgi:hypothetical protein